MEKTVDKKETIANDGKILKFDMNSDEESRASARKGYEVAKIFKEAGISFRKVIPAHSDESVKKLFKLGPSGPNLCLEIKLSKDEAEQVLQVENVRDQFLMMPDFILVNDKQYQLDRFNLVHRFLFRPAQSDR